LECKKKTLPAQSSDNLFHFLKNQISCSSFQLQIAVDF
jgi:hypothetical protein